jgi:diguanylate cyclase (GGDEF)-like protein/PAS domain S-box-containing protein
VVGLVSRVVRRDTLVPALAVGTAYFCVAAGSLALARWSNGIAAVWLPNAILLAHLLLTPRSRWLAACGAVFTSCVLANHLWGVPLPVASAFGLANVAEPLLVALVLHRVRRGFDPESVRDLLIFVGAAIVASSSAALLAALGAASGATFTEFWSSWFCSSLLGLVIATPLLLVGWKQLREPVPGWRQLLEEGAILLIVAALTAGVFMLAHWPFFFLLQPPVLVATFRLRAFGAAASALLIAVIATAAVSLGAGPSMFVQADVAKQMAFLQLFLAVSILTALPVAALLAQRDRYGASLARSQAQLAAVLDAVSDVIFRTDRAGRWTYLNPAWEQLTGYSVEESIGQSFLKQVVEEDRQPFLDHLRALDLDLFGIVRHQFRFRTASGEIRWAEAQSTRLNGSNGELIGSAGILVDVSDRLALAALAEDLRQQAEREAEAARQIAATDDLTGLASRRAFLAYFDQLLERGEALSVAIFDIDHFKSINDRYGHAVGDEVLKQVAAIAQQSVRDGDLVGRIGGEEFAVVMPGASIEQAARVGDRLRQSCADTVHPPGLTATISVGVSATSGGATSSALLREADAALYRAKFEGRNCLRIAA